MVPKTVFRTRLEALQTHTSNLISPWVLWPLALWQVFLEGYSVSTWSVNALMNEWTIHSKCRQVYCEEKEMRQLWYLITTEIKRFRESLYVLKYHTHHSSSDPVQFRSRFKNKSLEIKGYRSCRKFPITQSQGWINVKHTHQLTCLLRKYFQLSYRKTETKASTFKTTSSTPNV